MKNMKQKFRFAPIVALFLATAVQAAPDEIVVQQPPPLRGTYAGGEAMECPSAVYPAEARRYELEGKTVVELLIDNDGKAHGKRVLSSSGWKILDEATLSTMEACRFSPVTRDGRPAGAHWKKFAYVWALEDPKGKRPTRPILLPESCAGAARLILTDGPSSGTGVLLRFLTSSQGEAFGIKVEKSSGDSAIDDEARRALQACKFAPSQYDGKPGPGNAFARYQYETGH